MCGRILGPWFGVAVGYAAWSRDQLHEALPILVDLLRE
jgi:hypothetical protein